MTPADGPRERWLDGGSPGYQVLPEPVELEDTIALHPAAPAEPPPEWSAGLAAPGGGGDDGGD